jgi:O-antigen/teichoic acid export membrane protein
VSYRPAIVETKYPTLHRIVRAWVSPGTLVRSDLVRKVTQTFATQIVSIVLGLATTIIIARKLGPAGRGLYAVAAALVVIGIQLGNVGLHASNTYFVAKDRKLLPTLVGNSLVSSFVVGGLGAAVAGIVFLLWPRLAPVQGGVLWAALTWIPFGLACLLLQSLLLGIQEISSYNVTDLANRVLMLVGVALLALWGRLSPQSAVLAAVIAVTAAGIWGLARLRDFTGSNPEVSAGLFRKNLGVGFRAYLIAISGYLVLRIDLLMVQYMLGARESGYYSISSSLADYLRLLPTVVASILFAKLSASNDLGHKLALMKKSLCGTGAIVLPMGLVAAVLAGPAIRLLFGQAFAPSAASFIWLIPGTMALGMEGVAVQFLNSMGYPVSVIVVWFVSLALNVALNFWAIPAHGIIGASAVSSLTYIVTTVLILGIVFRGRYRDSASNPVEEVAIQVS